MRWDAGDPLRRSSAHYKCFDENHINVRSNTPYMRTDDDRTEETELGVVIGQEVGCR